MKIWNNLSIGKKQAFGFGSVLFLLIVLIISSYNGISSIVFNAKEVITGNQLDGSLAQREIDHLNWANEVNALLTDEKVTSLNVETNHTRCALGKWLNSEKRTEAEKLVPELASLFDELEGPHEIIHKSAIDINQTFRTIHKGLILELSNRLIDHLKWVSAMAQEIAEEAGGLYSYQNKLRNSTEAIMSIVKIVAENKQLGDVATRKKIVLDMVNKIRYGDKRDGYYWINDTNQVMVLHPIKPKLNGKDLSNFKDPKGKYIFREFVDICKKKDKGFICYYWPYPGRDEPVPKISYVSMYKPWGWIIGTGVYLDHTNNKLLQRAEDFASNTPFSFSMQKNPSLCKLGKYLNHPDTQKLMSEFPELKQILDSLIEPHNRLHKSAKIIEKYINELNVPAALSLFETETKEALSDITKLFAQAIKAEEDLAEKASKANKIYAEVAVPALKNIQGILKQIREIARDNIMTDTIMLEQATSTQRSLIFWGLIAVVIGLIMAYFIAQAIIKPIIKSVNFANQMAEGDFTVELNIDQKDEIGVLANALNSMIEKLNQMFKSISEGIKTLAASSTELSSVSQQLCNGADLQTSKANNVAAAAEEMSSNMQTVASGSEQANSNINTVASAAEEMSATINEISINAENAHNSTQAAVTQAQDTSNRVNELGNAVKSIGTVTETINEISEQTNLLALNATIEAARAGEAGKGFAVVANEIKELAKQTSGATDEIQKQIEDIQTSTSGAVIEIENITNVIKNLSESVSNIAATIDEQSNATKEIAMSIAQASTGLGDVSRSVSEVTMTSSEIAQNISELHQSSTECSSGSLDIQTSATDLSDLAERLKQMVDQYKVR